MRNLPTWPFAAGSLIAGFAVAQATGVRPIGGAVLLLGGAYCARRWQSSVGTGRSAGLVGFAFAAFVASHILADTLGSWGAVFTVSAAVAAVTYLVADAPVARRPLPA